MTRPGAKLVLVTLSLAATVGGWATLASLDNWSIRTGEDVALAAAAPRVGPTGGRSAGPRAVAAATAPSQASPATSGSALPRPLARTRSSR